MRLSKLLERILSAIPVAIGVAVLAFMFLRFLPGDPVEIMLGDTAVTQQQIDSLRSQLHLDKPLLEQLWLFFVNLFQGDLGTSFVRNQPVFKLITEALPSTIELTMATIFVAILIALPVGIISAVRAGSWLDRTVLSGALVGVSMPAFWFGLLLILLFSVELKLLPTSGRLTATMAVDSVTGFMLIDTLLAGDLKAFGTALKHLILPAVTLGVVFAAVLARVVRASIWPAAWPPCPMYF